MNLGVTRGAMSYSEGCVVYPVTHYMDESRAPPPQSYRSIVDPEILHIRSRRHGHNRPRFGIVDTLLDCLPRPQLRPVADTIGTIIGCIDELCVGTDRNISVIAATARRYLMASRVARNRHLAPRARVGREDGIAAAVSV